MDSNDIRNLQEAYNQVYQVDEAEKWIQKAIKKPGALSKQLGVPEDENIPAGKLAAAAKKGGKLGKRARLAMTLKGLRREEIDLYDIVFSHLLDEGYAANEEAAVAIMANMSEDWRDSIIEATGMFGTPRVPDIISGKASAANTIKAPTNVKPLPNIKSPFSKPASTTDSGKLTTYGAGGGAAAERAGQTRAQVMQQGAKNLETKNRNPGPNFGR